MSGIAKFYNIYILMTAVEVPMFVYVLLHVFVIIPINFLAFFIAYKTKNYPLKIKERLLKIGVIVMACVMAVRYALYALYVHKLHYFNTIIKFEMSEIAMYLLMLAIFVIKKEWFYPLTFTVAILSWISVFVYPYTVFSNRSPLHLYTVTSVLFHVLNGYLACMLLSVRNFVPRLKNIWGVLAGNVVLFCIILVANRVTGDNFMALSDASKLPIIGKTKPPVNVIIIYAVFNALSFAVLAVSEIVYKKIQKNSCLLSAT